MAPSPAVPSAPRSRLLPFALLFFLVSGAPRAAEFYTDWLWFQEVGFEAVFLRSLGARASLGAAVFVLAFSDWQPKLPLYFVILSISREILTIAGAFVIKFVAGKVEIAPHWTGKASTFTQIAAIGTAMLDLRPMVGGASAIASVFVVGSGAIYTIDAIRQITLAGHGNAES